jgi:phytoene desaturase
MGPSWYWMPDVFESFYNDFGKKTSDLYELERLDPGYQVVFGENESISIGDSLEKIYTVFEKEESGSSEKLKRFMASAKENYDIAIKDLVYRPGLSPWELVTPVTIRKINYFLSTIKKTYTKNLKALDFVRSSNFQFYFLEQSPQIPLLFTTL